MTMRLLLTLISKVPLVALYFASDAFYLLNRFVIRYRYFHRCYRQPRMAVVASSLEVQQIG